MKQYARASCEIDGRYYARGDVVHFEGKHWALSTTPPNAQDAVIKHRATVVTDGALISVIITFHNQRHYAKQNLDGWYAQTTRHAMQIIAVDDSSTDGIREFIREQYPEVTYVRVDAHNSAVGRNAGKAVATGKYICHFDGDDAPYPTYVQKLYDALQDNPQCNLAYSRFDFATSGLDKFRIATCNHFEWSPSWARYSPVVNTPTMMRRELAERIKWDESMYTSEDYEMNLQLVAAGAVGVHVRENLWFYRIAGDSKWGTGTANKNRITDDEYIKKKYGCPGMDDQPDTTFITMIARPDILTAYLENIAEIDMPHERMHWLVFIDSNDDRMVEDIKRAIVPLGLKFASWRVFVTNEVSLAGSKDFTDRGMRIARNLKTCINETRRWRLTTPYLFMTEDDTLVPANAYKKLRKQIEADDRLAYVSGVEPSRGSDLHIGAAIMTMNADKQIVHRINPPYKKSGIVPVNSGGWYCWMARTNIVAEWTPRCIEDGRFIGVDALMVFDLVQHGYRATVDWGIPCKHWCPIRGIFLTPADCVGWEIKYAPHKGTRINRTDGRPKTWDTTMTEITSYTYPKSVKAQ